MVGVVYPTIRSIIALESPEKNDDTQWLTYWSIYGILALLDELTSVVLTRIPGYFFFKVLFLIYLFSPLSNGAQKIYEVIVKPLLTKYQAQITQISNIFNDIFSVASPPVADRPIKIEEDVKKE